MITTELAIRRSEVTSSRIDAQMLVQVESRPDEQSDIVRTGSLK